MTVLQTTLGSTDTVPRDFGAVPHLEEALPISAETFVSCNLHDPEDSTTARSAEFWRRLSTPALSNALALNHLSSLDIQRQWQQLQPALFRVLWPKQTPPAVMSVEPPVAADLRTALHDVDGAVTEAQDEGFPRPSHTAVRNARRLLQDLYRLHRLRPSRLEAYPTPDGEIALVVSGGSGRSVLVLCDSSGGVLCSVNLNGRHRRARYSSATTLPDGFFREALSELDERDRV